MTREPWLWLVAGPNGAGKSTLAEEELSHLPNINPDVEASRLDPDQPGRAAVAGGRSAIAAARAAVAAGESFTLESTLSGRWHVALLSEARGAGWRLGLAYVGVRDPQMALARVRERYRQGGHDVPPADVQRRCHRSLGNLPAVLRLSDAAIIYDNSLASGYRRLLEANGRRIVHVSEDLPQWLTTSLPTTRLVVGAKLGPT